jgi:hypothetical protein
MIARCRRIGYRNLATAAMLAWWAAVIEVGLRATTLPRVAKIVGVRIQVDGAHCGVEGSECVLRSPNELRQLNIAGRVLRRGPFEDSCLRRAMLAGRILRHRDHAVRIGVRKVDGAVQAHAWLELDGVSLDPDAVDFYRPLFDPTDLVKETR